MKLLIIEDRDGEAGVMFVPDMYDDTYALEQADIVFQSGRVDKEIDMPEITHKGVMQYRLYREAA
jgi:hypothetical protein